jgi:hypothetical protein
VVREEDAVANHAGNTRAQLAIRRREQLGGLTHEYRRAALSRCAPYGDGLLRIRVLEEGRDRSSGSCDNDDRPQLKRDVKRPPGRSDRIL